LTWQAVVDGEEGGAQLLEHLDRCAACKAIYGEIAEAAGIADGLFTGAALRPGFAAAVLARVKPFPAGLVAAALFALVAVSALLLDPHYWHWWLTVGMTRHCGRLLDALIEIVFLGRSLGPAWLIGAAALLVALELVLLHKLKTVEEC
jgi:predicted anti-sigma-YlaC factor YlaD